MNNIDVPHKVKIFEGFLIVNIKNSKMEVRKKKPKMDKNFYKVSVPFKMEVTIPEPRIQNKMETKVTISEKQAVGMFTEDL